MIRLLVAFVFILSPFTSFADWYGYTPSKEAKKFERLPEDVRQSGEGDVVLLWKFYEKAFLQRYVPRDQGNTPTCVGQATASAVDMLQGVQIAGIGNLFPPPNRADANSIYGLARYQVAYEKHGGAKPSRYDGADVADACEALRDFGVLAMKNYGEVDLTHFDEELYKNWGNRGPPTTLLSEAIQHKIFHFAKVESYEDIRGAIANGYPVVVGSSVGFAGQPRRDANGFLHTEGIWMHAQVIIGIDDRFEIPGVCVLNSWGTQWLGGPKRYNQPDGSYWVSRGDTEKWIGRGEAFAVSGFEGFRSKEIDWDKIILK